MNETLNDDEVVANRLSYLLIVRAGVATLLLGIYLLAELVGSTNDLSRWLYAVVVASFLVVLVLGGLLRFPGSNAMVLAVAHLASAVVSTVFIVQLTGGIETPFSFLYLLAILDAAIIGGRFVALLVAGISTLAFGGQLVLQLYDLWTPVGKSVVTEVRVLRAFGTHALSFFGMATLSGYLARLMQRARSEASSVRAAFGRVEQQQRDVLASLPVGVLTLNNQNQVIAVNPTATEILQGVPQIGQEPPQTIRNFLQSTCEAGEIPFGERILSVTRSETASAISGGSDKLVVLVIEDRTELRGLEREVRRNERLAAVGAMSAALAHEIRNPLAGLSGAVELIFADPEDRSTSLRLEPVVHREIARLDKLIGEFLDYARPVEPEFAEVELDTLLRDVCLMAERDERAGGHRIVLNFAERPRVKIDPEQFRQVIWNLLLNALEASPQCGEVMISIDRDGEWWRIDMRDQGRGIDPQIREVMYEPFHTTKSGGTGLGLALVHRIMEAHGGRVRLDDASDGGAIASVWLPSDGRNIEWQ